MLGSSSWGAAVPGAGATQPWNGVVWPPDEVTAGWSIGENMTEQRLKGIPAIGRGLALIEGMAMQMPLDAMRGDVVLPRPRLLEQPDPVETRAWFVAAQIDDYWVHGNAVHLVTSRDATGWPATVAHLPASWLDMVVDIDGRRTYYFGGRELPTRDVVHVRRGIDPTNVHRGVGVLEQYTRSLTRIHRQESYEQSVLDGAAVPSVVVVTPNEKPSSDELNKASDRWQEKFGGPVRKPVFLPKGTEIKALSWSPADSQLVEARQLSLTDAANIMNLDAFWVGGSVASGLTYRSPGPMWLNLLRQTLAPILEPLELAWSHAWVPHGQRVRFVREAILAEDKNTTMTWVRGARGVGIITKSEARVALGYSAELPEELESQPAPLLAAPLPAVDDPNADEQADEQSEQE